MSTVIKVENLSKQYRLGLVGTGTFSHDLKRWWSKARGKEDPFLKIGEVNDRTTKGKSEYVWALKDINFEVKQGEVLGIIGKNGAGKSTLLKILSRTTSPTTGSVKIKGRMASLLEVGTGFHPDLTGRENIFMNGAILGMTRQEIKRKFDEIVDFSGVEKYIDTPVKRYSSGMYVRLAFAVAAHLDTEILIVDEVLAVGDSEFQKKCLGKMKDVSTNQGRTVLFVSHNMGVVTLLCDRAILLNNGGVYFDGGISETVEKYLSGREKSNFYVKNTPELELKNCFKSIWCTNENLQPTSDFMFDQSIVLNFEFVANDVSNNTQIGIGLNDRFSNRIFTILRPLDEFTRSDDGFFKGKVILPKNIIAPNSYNFTFALWTKDGHVYDLVENVCTIRVFDNGTELATYEGVNYGAVIIQPQWKND